jgi:hypothetical protein
MDYGSETNINHLTTGEIMALIILTVGIAVLLFSLHTPAMSANYKIDNPASSIYNPAARMDNPNPISPVTQPVPQPNATKEITSANPAIQANERPLSQDGRAIQHKKYYFKTVGAYINAAKKAFNRDDYMEFFSISEDALGRINAGTLRASINTKQKLVKYNRFGYELLDYGNGKVPEGLNK